MRLCAYSLNDQKREYIENTYIGYTLDRVSVPSPIAIDILMDTMARDRVHMYLFSV